ncbi:MAG: hypothetical protein FWF50_00585, partial [Defluviitaleaceae bacterium]|nr:hypothetical protein [Defluviitaleaceae bacterium]
MKKIVCVIFGITMVLSLLNVFIELNNRLSLEFLFHKNQHSIEIDLDPFENPDLNFREIVDHLLRFSEENDVVILNYVLLGETEINIYTSNFPDYSRIQLLEGNYPEGSQFLSNRKLGLDRSFQSGQIAFPFSNWNIRIYQMEQVANVGFGSRTVFHLLDASDEVAHLFMEEFSIYNETFLSESWQADFLREGLGFHLTNGQSESWLDVLSAPLGTALFFSYLTLFLAVILYLMKQRQRFL